MSRLYSWFDATKEARLEGREPKRLDEVLRRSVSGLMPWPVQVRRKKAGRRKPGQTAAQGGATGEGLERRASGRLAVFLKVIRQPLHLAVARITFPILDAQDGVVSQPGLMCHAVQIAHAALQFGSDKLE